MTMDLLPYIKMWPLDIFMGVEEVIFGDSANRIKLESCLDSLKMLTDEYYDIEDVVNLAIKEVNDCDIETEMKQTYSTVANGGKNILDISVKLYKYYINNDLYCDYKIVAIDKCIPIQTRLYNYIFQTVID
jgi:hypothetical protein